MSEIVHITFEKLTGLKGTIEGVVECENPEMIDEELPIIFVGFCAYGDKKGQFIFRQLDEDFYLKPVEVRSFDNYKEHFRYGTNFLIKEWSYGGGVRINSQNPN